MFSKGRSVGAATSVFLNAERANSAFFLQGAMIWICFGPNIDIYNLNLRFVDLCTLPNLVYPANRIRPAAPGWSVAICDVELCMSPISTSENCKSSLACKSAQPNEVRKHIPTDYYIYDLSLITSQRVPCRCGKQFSLMAHGFSGPWTIHPRYVEVLLFKHSLTNV